MKKLFFILIICMVFFLRCWNSSQTHISQEDFLKENLSQSFDNWENWMISYRSGKYIAIFQSDISEYRNQLIFGRDDSIWIRLTLSDTISKKLSIRTLPKDSLWNKYQQMNIEDLILHINFVFKYKLDQVYNLKNPNRIYFHSDSIDLLYFFEPRDSCFGLYENKINSNWYTPARRSVSLHRVKSKAPALQ